MTEDATTSPQNTAPTGEVPNPSYITELFQINSNRRLDSAFRRAKQYAFDKVIDFSITQDDVQVPTNCPILGIPLIDQQTNSPIPIAIERIDLTRGYHADNIRVVSAKSVNLRRQFSLEELATMGQFAAQQLTPPSTV